MRKIWKLLFRFILTIVGIFLITNLPYLFINFKPVQIILTGIYDGEFQNGDFFYSSVSFRPKDYFYEIYQTFINLFHLNHAQYFADGHLESIFPNLWGLYFYSMKILVLSLVIALIFSGIISFLIVLMPVQIRAMFKSVFKLFQSIPDIVFILILQFLVILFIEKTGWSLFKVYGGYGDRLYALPILSLFPLPTIFITHYMLDLLEEEEEKLYVELAKTKGIKKALIYLKHIYRNILGSFFIHFKSIFWFTLSSLLIIEVLFGKDGFLYFVYRYAPATPNVLTFAILMIFIPFFIIFILIQSYLGRKGWLNYENNIL